VTRHGTPGGQLTRALHGAVTQSMVQTSPTHVPASQAAVHAATAASLGASEPASAESS
jgi:hypothetical protein